MTTERHHSATPPSGPQPESSGGELSFRLMTREIANVMGLGATSSLDHGCELRPGDVLFGRRPSWVQHLLGLAGDFLSHCGMVIADRNELRVAEFGPQGAFTRSVSEFVEAYELYSYLRPTLHPACRANVARLAAARVEQNDWQYCWPAGMLLDAGLVARRYAPRAAEHVVEAATLALARRLRGRYQSKAITCAGFVLDCLDESCGTCRSEVGWPSRDRVPGWRTSPSIADARRSTTSPDVDRSLVRLLVSPFDLWVSVPNDFKAVVAEGRVTILYDVAGPPPPSTPAALAA